MICAVKCNGSHSRVITNTFILGRVWLTLKLSGCWQDYPSNYYFTVWLKGAQDGRSPSCWPGWSLSSHRLPFSLRARCWSVLEEGCHCHSDAPLVSQLVTLITGRKGRGGTSPVDRPHCQRQHKEWRWQAGELGTAPKCSTGLLQIQIFNVWWLDDGSLNALTHCWMVLMTF